MATRLVELDRRAIDYLLSGELSPPENAEGGFDGPSQIQFQQRVAVAQRWLRLAGVMPAEMPSVDLVAATLQRVDAARAAEAGNAAQEDNSADSAA